MLRLHLRLVSPRPWISVYVPKRSISLIQPIKFTQLILNLRYYSTERSSFNTKDANGSKLPKDTYKILKQTKIVAKSKENYTKSKENIKKLTQPIKDMIPEHENIYTIPNLLTFTRLISAPVIGYLIVKQKIWWSLGLFVYSCLTDFVDGFIARKFKMHSVVGSVIDPMADKFLMVICTACLTSAGQMPLYLCTLILGRDILLGLSAIYYRYISLPPPKTLMRFFDFSIPSAEVHPTTISKYNTGFQMLYIAGAVVKPVLSAFLDPSLTPLLESTFGYYGYFVGTTTVISGLSYVFSKNAVKVLTKQRSQ